ncbi:MAG: HAMP domain-containing histidine kinase [Clostridia bacterium]|nr:HAMP domain-containing histidine kinase [Clostridia bacterium]
MKQLSRHNEKSYYAKIRKQRKPIFNLRIRLMLFVTLELLASVALAYIVDFFINDVVLKLLNEYIFKNILPFEVSFPFWIDLVIISILVGIFATFGLSMWLLRPIKKLEAAMAKIADGDLSVRILTQSSSREIQEIYAGFNLMAEELGSTEILQTDFVSNVSHEFKTPINAIEGYSMLLQDSDNLTEEQNEYVEKILFNTKRLSTLTGSILLLSKIENQKISTNNSNIRLDEQIRETIVAIEPLWEKKGVEFDIEMENVVYFGNEMLMRHVWSNLVGNAIKFGPEDGTVRIRLYTNRKGEIVFTVTDMGEGLSEDAKKHIFDKFYQGDSSHKAEGNGLGLSLVKKILDLEGGSIYAENPEEGGCKFTVVLKSNKERSARSLKKGKQKT